MYAGRRSSWRSEPRPARDGRCTIAGTLEQGLRAQLDRLPAGLRPKLSRDERVVIIDNPHASGGRYASHGERAGSFYRILGYDCEVWPTEAPGHATELARRAASAGATLVVGCGGDGVVREAVVGLMQEPDAAKRPKFSVVPKGTVNVFARVLSLQIGPIPDFFHACLKQVFWARERRVDVARLDGDPFVCFAGFGFDAAVIENVPADAKRNFREWAFVSAAFRTLFRFGPEDAASRVYEPVPMRVRAEAIGRSIDESGYIAAVGNVQFYGPGWFPFHPQARVDDGLLDVVLITTRDKAELLRIAGQVLRRVHPSNPHVEYFQTPGPIRIDSLADPVPMHADCELVGRRAGSVITLEPAALTVLH